jgi:hypothetical protein
MRCDRSDGLDVGGIACQWPATADQNDRRAGRLPFRACQYSRQGDVVVCDAKHLRDLPIHQLTTRPEVEHMEAASIFEFHRAGALPMYQQE